MDSSKQAIAPTSLKFRLRTALVVPFVLQIVTAVGLVGYLSFRNGHKAVNDLVLRLQSEASSRIYQHLDTFLATPAQINQINVDDYNSGNLNLLDYERTWRQFYSQMKTFKSLNYIGFGRPQGSEYVGIGREADGRLYMAMMRSSYKGRYKQYELDSQGKPTRVTEHEAFEYVNDSGFTEPVKAGKPVWAKINYWADKPDIVTISCSYPVYDKSRNLVGVIGTELFLPQLNTFLQNLKVTPSGKIFILERDGLVVATSTDEKSYRIKAGKPERLNVVKLQDPLIRATGQQLIDRFANLSQISESQQFQFNLNNEPTFVQVLPWRDKLGLDWLIVVVIPESDFMGEINNNTRITMLLCLLALGVAIAVAILTASWITRPINRIAKASAEMADGNFNQNVEPSQIIELSKLANSFNSMAKQLNNSFDKLNEVILQANQVGMKVTSSTKQIATAGKQLEATVTQQSVSTNEVKATATEIASTSGKLAKTMEDIAQKAQSTATSASHSQSSLEEMATVIHQLATFTRNMSSRLQMMNEKANNINSVVTMITQVADQTNLLSLNAAIEAEKAGEYGSGFGVVAIEVRWLANKASRAASEIQDMVKEIQVSVGKGVTEMDKFSQDVGNYVKRVSFVSEQMTAVIDQVQSLTPQFEQVSQSMEGQFEGASQISSAISQLSEASVQTVTSLKQTNQVLDQLNNTAQVLQGIISRKVAE
ncbi:methyl-accepting chemotaxis protein [Argonema antarcticum]|uniref:methyl-accepting chemotaxis protein n=1 Tax=Argonema antarcticum TaxID=2942763 RepID=UPI00201356DF|nr:methyl-accepting chemotaxis protein [Argonema antarcticum]MCL1469745.1 methyl-accepting chemotaxis protein [Argonema antarcticum A004/B2]